MSAGLEDEMAKSHSRRGGTVPYGLFLFPNPLQTQVFFFFFFFFSLPWHTKSSCPELCCLVFAAQPLCSPPYEGACRTAAAFSQMWSLLPSHPWPSGERPTGEMSSGTEAASDCLFPLTSKPITEELDAWSPCCGPSHCAAGITHLEGWVQEGHCALGGMQRCCGCSAAS